MSQKILRYQGSVKTVYESSDQGESYFSYSDRYSLFDWGEMPDLLANKGEALATMGALFFASLSQQQIPHHFLSLVTEAGQEIKEQASAWMKVKNLPVVRPQITAQGYDYSFYQQKPQAGLVPLEVMFRFGVGKGSSLLQRAKERPELLRQWNLQSLQEGDFFTQPLIDFSTKLEKGDRYLTHQEARELAGLDETEWQRLQDLTTKVALALQTLLKKIGYTLWDGKIELGFVAQGKASRDFMVVDSIGLDELRLEKDGLPYSKEFLREFYRRTEWYQSLVAAKKQAQATGLDFKELCRLEPPPLPPEIKQKAEALYREFTDALATEIWGHAVFQNLHKEKR
jgi:phosphoribosylaminoimidazole-succinocarboxamide synthase